MQDLSYTVRSHHNKKVELSLLTSVSGFFNPGQMSALVGGLKACIVAMSNLQEAAWQEGSEAGWVDADGPIWQWEDDAAGCAGRAQDHRPH